MTIRERLRRLEQVGGDPSGCPACSGRIHTQRTTALDLLVGCEPEPPLCVVCGQEPPLEVLEILVESRTELNALKARGLVP
jgi:hypothetical protein